jgi:hypothetical protein
MTDTPGNKNVESIGQGIVNVLNFCTSRSDTNDCISLGIVFVTSETPLIKALHFKALGRLCFDSLILYFP